MNRSIMNWAEAYPEFYEEFINLIETCCTEDISFEADAILNFLEEKGLLKL